MTNSSGEIGKRAKIVVWLKGTALTGIVALLLVNFFVAAQTARKPTEGDTAYRTTKLWEDVRELVRQNYVDGSKTGYESLTYSALKGMLDALDPHSQFLDPKMLEQMREETNQKFGGLGIEITHRDGLPTVIAPIEDTPAFFKGILPGDKITKVDDQRTDRMTLSEVVSRLKGLPGTEVKIQIFRPHARDLKDRFRDITITRAEIKVASVRDVKIIHEKEKIGYLRLTQFGERTDEELEEALQKLEKQGMRALVMDLRNNPGGLLETATKVCSKFIPKGQLIVKTMGRRRSQNEERYAKGGEHPHYPIALLVNNASASASEIVAGCLQDHQRAILVGEKTFGKGSVQSIVELDPIEIKDSEGKPAKLPVAVKLTTAEYRTPSDRPIHGHGIMPDIYVPLSDEDASKLNDQRIRDRMREKGTLPKEVPSDVGIGEEPKEKPVEDVQLNRAVDAMIGVLIFAQTHSSPVEAIASK